MKYTICLFTLLVLLGLSACDDDSPVPLEKGSFIFTWKTDSPNEEVVIPINDDYDNYDYTINWGDGVVEQNQKTNAMHTYSKVGTYTIQISGDFHAMKFSSTVSFPNRKIQELKQWGSIRWKSMERMFEGHQDLVYKAQDKPNLSEVESMHGMFEGCKSFNGYIEDWDVGKVENMQEMFEDASAFNQSLGDWNIIWVTNVNNMLSSTALSTKNYDETLIGWAANATNIAGSLRFEASGLKYYDAGEAARNKLRFSKGWVISGDTKATASECQ